MLLLAGAFIAGVLTTLAPCVLPLLPVIVGGSISQSGKKSVKRAFLIAGSLGLSVIIFTLLLKATTYFIDIPNSFWQWISGLILISLGLFSAKPAIWERISMKLLLQSRSTPLLSKARQREGMAGAIFTGAALGPFAYSLGLSGTLLAIALIGQRLIKSLGWAANPEGLFRKGLGWVFIIVGIIIIAGWDKDIQTWILETSPIRPWEIDSKFIP